MPNSFKIPRHMIAISFKRRLHNQPVSLTAVHWASGNISY